MPLSHALKDLPSSCTDALEALLAQISSLGKQAQRCEDFQGIEEKLHHGFMEAECAVIGELLSHYDVDLPVLEGKETTYRRTLRCEQTYFSAAGPVRVMRSLYRTRRNGPTCCALDWRAGIVEGRWTPRAAKVATEMVANMTPGEAERLLDSLGGMRPSKSTLDRLP